MLLVDDSIVRGTTITQIIQLAEKRVRGKSTWPAQRLHCDIKTSGIDMPARDEFVAHQRTEEKWRKLLVPIG